jgi:pyruvate dehydrogenase E2 component (dihydrolipoamide acetyltransferase)
VLASPYVRKTAREMGVDLAGAHGSGPGGRVVATDLDGLRAAAARSTSAATPPSAASRNGHAEAGLAVVRGPSAPFALAEPDVYPLSMMRRTIARRLTEAKQTVPHFYVSMDIEIDALLKLREELNAKSPKEGPSAFRLSVNDLIIKAAAITLRRIPRVNASFTEDAVVLYDDVDISVAVSIPDGLITPIVRKADQKGLAAISGEMKDLAARARIGKLKPEEFQGGGFSISNMGMYGVSEFAAIINPPQAAILAVAAGQQRPVVKNGALAIATVMTCTLSVDHRVVDGALGAEWLAAFKTIVEDPLSLML